MLLAFCYFLLVKNFLRIDFINYELNRADILIMIIFIKQLYIKNINFK